MKKPLILLLITIIICCTDLAIITSATSTLEFTSLNFSSSYSTVNPQFYHAQSSKDLEAFLNDLDSQAVLDITHSLIYSEIISKNAENQNFLHIKLESSYPTNGVNTFTASVLKSKEMLAANQLISTLNITSYGIVYLQHLKLEYEEIISSASVSLVLPPVYTSDYLKKLLNLYIRYSEVNTIVLLLPGDLAAQVLQVANLDFEDLGFVWILLPIANYLEYTQFTALESNGPILMQSDFDTLEIRLHNVYKGLEYCSDTTISLIRCFSELFRFGDDHYIEPFYSVLNTQNSTYVRVGDLSPDSCKITGYLKWSGGSKSEKVISIQQEAGLYSPTGAYLGFLAPAYNGAELAVDYLNNNNAILSGFMLKRNTYNFGALYYNRTFMNEAFTKAKDQLKTVMIAPAISDVTINLYNTLKNNSIALPMIGYANTVDSLTSSTVYPWFTRVNMASGYIGYLLGTIVKYFGWSRIGVLYLDNIFAKNVYNAFKSETEEEKITIINLDVDMLPDNSPNWKHEEIDPILLNLGNSDAQVILMICYTQDATSILTRMWELGFRNQNRVIIAVGWLVKEMVMQDKASTTYNETRLNILRDSLRGSLMFFPVSFFGDFGEQIFKFYQTKFTSDPVGYSGFAFDAVMAAAYALDQVITQGKDYNDPKILINAIRNIRFVGATGIVKIEDKANDRAPMDHNIFNCKEISKDNWEVRKVGVFSPTGSKVFTYYEDIIWPDGTSVTPSDTPDPLDCPFEDSESKSSFKGFMMMCSIGLVVIAAAIISSSLVWKKWKKVTYANISKKTEMTFYDMLAISRIIVEFFQLVGLSPPVPAVFDLIKFVGNASSMDLDNLYKSSRNYAWISFQAVFAVLVITFFIRLAPILRIYVPYTKVIMSLALDLFYVAILSTMMNIFVCREATGDELLQTFMEFDCYTSCWQGTHLIYAIIGLVLVLIFVVFGAIERPKWQSLDGSEQSVLLTPNFITLKSFVMTFIIVIKKVTIHDMKILYVCFFTVISACYLGIIIHQKPYNLRVLNLWYILSVAALCWLNIIAILYYASEIENPVIWLSLMIVGWGCICFGGLAYQKLRKMYWPFSSGIDKNEDLYRFAFQKSSIQEAQKLKRNLRFLENSDNLTCFEMTFRGKKDNFDDANVKITPFEDSGNRVSVVLN